MLCNLHVLTELKRERCRKVLIFHAKRRCRGKGAKPDICALLRAKDELGQLGLPKAKRVRGLRPSKGVVDSLLETM